MLLLLSTPKSDQASDLWQQLELASELECGHRIGTGYSLLISIKEKLRLFYLTGPITLGAIGVKNHLSSSSTIYSLTTLEIYRMALYVIL